MMYRCFTALEAVKKVVQLFFSVKGHEGNPFGPQGINAIPEKTVRHITRRQKKPQHSWKFGKIFQK